MFRLLRKSDPEELEVTVSNRTIVRVILLVVATLIILLAIRQSAHTLVLIGIAFFLALALNAPIHWVSKHLPGRLRGSRGLATALSIIIVFLVLGGFLAAIVPPLVRQTNSFIQSAPHLVEEVRSQNSGIGQFVRKYHLQKDIDKFSHQLSDHLGNLGSSAVGTVTSIASSVLDLAVVVVLTIMMLVEGPRWARLLRALLPNQHQAHASRLAHDMYRVIRGYVNGQVILAAIAAALIVPMLFILHVSYPLALMVVIFICGLIPLVGHTIGAIIVTLVALFHSPVSAIIILAYYILYINIENYVIQPRLQATATNMSPLLVFLAVILGVNFGGILGALVAIPVMGCIRVAVLDYLEEKEILTKQEHTAATGSTK